MENTENQKTNDSTELEEENNISSAEENNENEVDTDNKQAELEQQIEELKSKLLRQMAETENVRNRNFKALQDAKDYAVVSFAKDMTAVMDNLALALEHAPKELDENSRNVIEGVRMTYSALEESFKKNGITIIMPKKGDQFDYNQHCAISQLESDEVPSGNIISVMQRGYQIKDRLLRAASVIVAK